VKLKKQISQGLLLPLDTVGWNVIHSWKEDPVGTDLTELLGIQKWEAPINAQLVGMARGNFPSFVPKTDQERIQNCWRNVERVKTEQFEVTQKLDGSSMTAYYRRHPEYGADFGICSRNLSLSGSRFLVVEDNV
jgi:RNA ligase (TIGR02306 family)